VLEKIMYINHLNEKVCFGEDGVYANENDLRDFSWNVGSRNNKIATFKKGLVKKSLQYMIACRSRDEGTRIKNRIFEIMEKDILTKTPGKMIIGDYYLQCFVSESRKSEYLINEGYMIVDLTIQTDNPEWIRETTTSFSITSVATVSDAVQYLDYEYDYPHDYASGVSSREIINSGIAEAAFRMIFYGPCTNPTIYISGHKYAVNVDVAEGEYLTVDSTGKTIILTRYDGEKVNCYGSKDRDWYIFKRIPTGPNEIIIANDSLNFDITLLEERSEPAWI